MHQIEGSLRILYRFKRRLLLRQCIQSVVIYLLDLLIERLLGVVELQLLILALDFRRADAVTRLETVENGDIQVQTDVLREVIPQLCTEIVGLETAGSVVVRAHTATERERGVITCASNLNVMLGAFEFQLLSSNLWFDAKCLGVDDVGRRDGGSDIGRDIGKFRTDDGESVGRRKLEELCEGEDSQPRVVVSLGR